MIHKLRERDSRPYMRKIMDARVQKTEGPILIEFSPFDLLLPS